MGTRTRIVGGILAASLLAGGTMFVALHDAPRAVAQPAAAAPAAPPVQVPWGVTFPQGIPPTTAGNFAASFGTPMAPGVSPETLVAVHPTQLYEAVLMIGVFMLLWRLRNSARPAGWLFGLYLALAGTERFLVEFLRAKADRLAVGLTVAQLTALAILVLGGVLMAAWSKGPDVAPGEYLPKGKSGQGSAVRDNP